MKSLDKELYSTNDYFISSTLRKYLIPTILAILGTTAVSFVNTLLAGRWLGTYALTAMNIVSSFTFLFAMLGCLINIGASSCASLAIGKGKHEEAGEYESFAFLFSCILPLTVSIILLLILRPFLFWLGADEALYTFMRDYAVIAVLTGFLTTLMYFPFNFLRLDGRAGNAMIVFVVMGVLDIAFMLLFLNMGLGLIGVAFATALSTAIADLGGILILYRGKGRQIIAGVIKAERFLVITKRIFRTGAASGMNNLCNMLRTLVLNGLILHGLGPNEAGEFAVACSLITFASASVMGCGQTVAPLAGVFFGERDYVSVRILIRKTLRYGLVIHTVLLALIIPLAQPLVRAFGITEMTGHAAMILRFAAASLIPSVVVNIFIFYYTIIHENILALSLTFLRAFGFVVLFAEILFAVGLGGWYIVSFVLAEIASFGTIAVVCSIRKAKNPDITGLLLLRSSKEQEQKVIAFSVPGDKEGAVEASRNMEQFCDENDVNMRLAMMLPLALEELLVVMNEHCLENDSKKFADVRIYMKDDELLLRIRCGGKIFDPMDWYRKRKTNMSIDDMLEDETLGIKMIDQKAKSITFQRTLGVNNLIVEM